MKLLAHHDVNIKQLMYKLCLGKIIAAIGPRLNQLKSGAPGSQVQFILRSKVFLEIVVFGLVSKDLKVAKYSEDIVIHILKCKILVSDSIWQLVIDAISATYPMLICFADKQSSLGNAITGIFDPDVAKTYSIPQLDVRFNITYIKKFRSI